MKFEIFITSLLCLPLGAVAQPDSVAFGGDTARMQTVQQTPGSSNLQDFDELMIAPPQKMYLPLRPQSLPLSLYTPTYGSNNVASKNNFTLNQDLNNFYNHYNAWHSRMLHQSTSDKVFGIIGISATAFVWGTVVKQAIEGAPNPNQPPQKRQNSQPIRKP